MQRIFFGDSQNLDFIPDGSVDLIVTAPPYLESDYQYSAVNNACFKEFFKKMKNDTFFVSVTHDLKNIGRPSRHLMIYTAAMRAGFSIVEHKVWLRRETLNIFRKTFAHIWVFKKGEPKYTHITTEYRNDVWRLPFDMKVDDYDQAFHPRIPEIVIESLSIPGDTVLDPFVGAGTTLKATEKLRRLGIGVDIDSSLRRFYPPNWEIKNA